MDLLIKAEPKITEIFYMVDGLTKEFVRIVKPTSIPDVLHIQMELYRIHL